MSALHCLFAIRIGLDTKVVSNRQVFVRHRTKSLVVLSGFS